MEKFIDYLVGVSCIITVLTGLFFILDLVWGFIDNWIPFKVFITSLIVSTIFLWIHDIID
jgi:hypothetical protein